MVINGAEVLSRTDGTYRRSIRYVLFRCRWVIVLGSFFKTGYERTCRQSSLWKAQLCRLIDTSIEERAH